MDYIYADLDDIVFEAREKRYGAYQMRKKSSRYLSRAALIAFLLFLVPTAMPKMLNWVFPGDGSDDNLDKMVVSVNLSDLPPPPSLDEEDEPPPPPPENLPPPKPPSIEFKVPVPKPDEEVKDDETIEEMEKIEESNPDFETNEGDPNAEPNWDDLLDDGDGKPQEVKVAQEPDPDPNKFVLLEKEPEPVNLDDLTKLIGYPDMAKQAEIEGKVVVRVLIDQTGNYVKHIVVKNPHALLTTAVEKQIRHLKFTPGIQGNKPIKVWVTIPFAFSLTK